MTAFAISPSSSITSSVASAAAHGDRRPAIGGTVRPGFPRHDVVARDHRAERQPARDALARGDDVGRDAFLLDRPHRAAPPHARLDLVADEHDAVAVAEVPQVAEPPLGREHVATFAQPGLHDDRRDLARGDDPLEQHLFEVVEVAVERVVARSAAWGRSSGGTSPSRR